MTQEQISLIENLSIRAIQYDKLVADLVQLHVHEDPLSDGGWCGHCRDPWPCTTMIIVHRHGGGHDDVSF